MCEAFKLGMTQKQGYVWFLPAWYQSNWYDIDVLKDKVENENLSFPNCTTAEMVEVRMFYWLEYRLGCPLSKGNQANHPKFERPNEKNTKCKFFLKSVQNWSVQLT